MVRKSAPQLDQRRLLIAGAGVCMIGNRDRVTSGHQPFSLCVSRQLFGLWQFVANIIHSLTNKWHSGVNGMRRRHFHWMCLYSFAVSLLLDCYRPWHFCLEQRDTRTSVRKHRRKLQRYDELWPWEQQDIPEFAIWIRQFDHGGTIITLRTPASIYWMPTSF